LIPWTIAQQYQDEEFGTLSGARLIRIATNPEFMSKGYGSRALSLLKDYYLGKFTDISERGAQIKEIEMTRVSDEELKSATLSTDNIQTRDPKSMPSLFMNLNERAPEKLDYLGVSYGLTSELHKFWKRAKFVPVYLRQTSNELTGEHTCIMLHVLREQGGNHWLDAFAKDFRKRFLNLLGYEFRKFSAIQALSIIEAIKQKNPETKPDQLNSQQLYSLLSPYDLKRLESYANNLLDYHVIVDLLPLIAQLYFSDQLSTMKKLSGIQSAIILGIGLQKKDMEIMANELNLPISQTMGHFAKIIKRASKYFNEILTGEISKTLPELEDGLEEMDGKQLKEVLKINREQKPEVQVDDQDEDEDEEQGEDEEMDEETAARKDREKELIKNFALKNFSISQEAEWDEEGIKRAAKSGGVVSVKSGKAEGKRKGMMTAEEVYQQEMGSLKKNKKSKR
jgi:N-acetyltransferase 10